MATVGPTYHGGDTGGDLLPNHSRFLPYVNQEKLDSLELDQRLLISFDKTGTTWRAIKENQKYFPHLIRVHNRKNTKPFHKSWAK
ncbi:hypothetical protein PanWU01x14_200450, partial [Parasponia andersonii]